MFSSATKSAAQGGGYNLTKSLRFRSSASAYLNRTPSSASNRKTWTYSIWLKIGALNTYRGLLEGYTGSPTFANRTSLQLEAGNKIDILFDNSTSGRITTTQVFRDPSSWYHFVFACDTTQATASNRFKIYVNGIQITAFDTATYPAQNYDTGINNSQLQNIGKVIDPLYFDGYMTEINFIDGQALTPSSFGSTNATTGVWQPARYTGTYGTNGFYLPFTNTTSTTTLGYDSSGNGNNWTTNNISLTTGSTYDSMTDVPTLTSATVANYAVMNPLTGKGTLTNGNLAQAGATSNWGPNIGSMAFPASGNFYCEVYINSTTPASNGMSLGVCASSVIITTNADLKSVANTYVWQNYTTAGNNLFLNTVGSNYNSSSVYTTGQTVGISVNNGTLTFYKNGTSQGTATTGLTGDLFFIGSPYSTDNVSWNFGQQAFTYTPPSGSKTLNAYNLPDSTIVKGNKYMDATTYTGTLVSNAVTNAGAFKPDLVWVKSRSAATDHKLTDSVRGTTKALISDTTGAETTDSQGLTAFGTSGFTVGTDTNYNNLSATYVGWQWQAGAGSSSSNTNGSITSTVSASTTAGFSIVTYTGNGTAGATVGHGLGVAPTMIIVKNRSSGTTDSWAVYQQYMSSTPQNDYLFLNQTAAKGTNIVVWNNTAPTSSVFSVGTDGSVNVNTKSYVAYCWAAVPGFSAFGSYTGNGSSDGPFIYTGFLPKFVMYKCSSAAYNWTILDTSRSPYNTESLYLNPNLSNAEGTAGIINGLSNGFQIVNSDVSVNGSGSTYIYAAFAENPFKNALAR